ncbi:hypothetical protein ABIA99_002911 [Bradyrhizobium sp. LB12.1]|uniref:hypothetical protein n=1 Tax=Bradyrhizobium sp. LB12.1 TaxID=3156327 RepID=UPI0033921251
MFDAATAFSVIVPDICGVLVFTLLVFWCAALFRGKGQLRYHFAGLIFSSAFLPILQVADYVPNLDPEIRNLVLSGSPAMVPSVFGAFAMVMQLFVYVWIVAKIVPLVSAIHSFGRIRALLAVLIGGALSQVVAWFVFMPFFAELVKRAAKA